MTKKRNRFNMIYYDFLDQLAFRKPESPCPDPNEITKPFLMIEGKYKDHLTSCGNCFDLFIKWHTAEYKKRSSKKEIFKSIEELKSKDFHEEPDEEEISETVMEIQEKNRKTIEELSRNKERLFKLPGLKEIERTEEIGMVLDFYQKSNFSAAFHISRKALNQQPHDPGVILLHAFSAIAAGRGNAALSIMDEIENKISSGSAVKTTSSLFRIFALLSLGLFHSAFSLISRNIEMSRMLLQDEILQISMELQHEIEAVRFASAGFELGDKFEAEKVHPVVLNRQKSLSERIKDALEAFMTLPGSFTDRFAHAVSHDRYPGRIREKLRFHVIDLTILHSAYTSIKITKSVKKKFNFFDLPDDYISRRVYLAIMSDYDIRKKYPDTEGTQMESALRKIFLSGRFLEMDIELKHVQAAVVKEYKSNGETKGCFEFEIPDSLQDQILRLSNQTAVVIT